MSSPTIPVELLDRLQQIADHQQRTVAEVLSTLLDEAYPAPADPEPPAGINLALLEQALADLREGLSEDDLTAITWAMNVEYVEQEDTAQWDDPATS